MSIEKELQELRDLVNALASRPATGSGPGFHDIEQAAKALEKFDARLSDLENRLRELPKLADLAALKTDILAEAKKMSFAMLQTNLKAAMSPVAEIVTGIEDKVDATISQFANDVNLVKAAAHALPVSAADSLLSMAHRFAHSAGD
jgi:uncharacterized protein YhaN